MGYASWSIRCCAANLMRHRYGDVLNELQAEGADIGLDSCQSRCAGCVKQAAYMADGSWFGFDTKEQLREAVRHLRPRSSDNREV
jgi:hypothetical protein